MVKKSNRRDDFLGLRRAHNSPQLFRVVFATTRREICENVEISGAPRGANILSSDNVSIMCIEVIIDGLASSISHFGLGDIYLVAIRTGDLLGVQLFVFRIYY